MFLLHCTAYLSHSHAVSAPFNRGKPCSSELDESPGGSEPPAFWLTAERALVLAETLVSDVGLGVVREKPLSLMLSGWCDEWLVARLKTLDFVSWLWNEGKNAL